MTNSPDDVINKALQLLSKQYRSDDTFFNLRNNKYWNLIAAIKTDRAAAISLGLRKLNSKNTVDRFFGITLLSEICNPIEEDEEADAEKIGNALADLANTETTLICKNALADAFGMMSGEKPRAALLKLSTHGNNEVRWSATTSLGHYTDDDKDSAVFERLVALSTDTDAEIREWATMWLGSCLNYQDKNEALEPILMRLKDRHIGTKIEAAFALAEHNDMRALKTIKWLLSRNRLQDVNKVIEAAGLLGTPELAKYLDGWETVESRDTLNCTHANLIDWSRRRCSNDPAIRASVDDVWADDKAYAWMLNGGRKPITYRDKNKTS